MYVLSRSYIFIKWFCNNNNNDFKKCVEALAKTSARDFKLVEAYYYCMKFLKVQSEDVIDDQQVEYNNSQNHEVLTFIDSSTGLIDDIGYTKNPIASQSATDNTSLENFLSRPTLIDSRTWTTSDLVGNLGSTIEPWHLFLSNATILNKLQNYAFIRAKLCIKIVINATPFHFGLMRIAYEPSVNAANNGSRFSKIRTNPTSALPYLIPYSQLPGTWIYPADNSGGELRVPFFRHTNWLNLKLAADAKTMGTLSYYIASVLGVATSSGSTSLAVDTFAWLEDVELSGSTAELILQAKDEYDGPISRSASAVAGIASKLDSVPVIGKFARATVIGASAIADIASMFGFTNTPIIDDVHGYTPLPGAHLASSQISTPVQKLTLDPKQELSIDPSLHGLGSQDEMAISNIISKESALVVGGWSTSNPTGTIIFNCRVSPMLFGSTNIFDTGLTQVAYRIYHTPMSYAGMLFQHWRGDIIFDIDVICTKFHKGRLKITWDPIGGQGSTAVSENKVFTSILDIGETNRTSFRVPFHQAYSFLRMRGITAENWSLGSPITLNSENDNGMLVISVLTPLISPVSPQSVGLKISVRGAENLEFANPASSIGESSAGQPPSYFDVQGKDEVDIQSNIITLGDIGTKHPERYSLNIGERVVSLRTLLHRYAIYDFTCMAKNGATKAASFAKSFSRLPPSYGYDPNGLSTASKIKAASGTAPFNYTPTHPITYVAMMYGAFRGGVNYVANVSSDLYPYIGDVKVQRLTDTTESSARAGVTLYLSNTGSSQSNYRQFMLQYAGAYAYANAGAAFTNTQTNGALSWYQPHMAGTNFNYADTNFSILGNSSDQSDRECSYLQILVKQTTANTSTDTLTLTTYAGSGADFTCLWWLCCPTVDYYTVLPNAG